ncbi:hypothetical protein D9758_015307 [Tetrapyrgos nigripes]|uniref:Ubiquinol-cytochrome C reductase hinge domain-containing protein n=1 Tax=Tetrapyrgos nigripes TaxID=182062 RepID=A0A8H5FJV0_9AGAR|nr:hypothetical protein D9758_015307 [Tetrapyrgos nigripes]
MDSITSFFSSLLPTVHNDAEEKPETESKAEANQGQEEASEEAPEEEEEEEPEDVHPQIREECKEASKCAPLVKHFEHCQERVQSGKGFKGEECVEELCKLL